MENELIANNVTLASLRGLLRAARKNAAPEEAVYVELMLWDYGESVPEGRITERVGVYRSETGEGTQKFKGVKKAREYIEGWKEEDANVYRPEGASSVED